MKKRFILNVILIICLLFPVLSYADDSKPAGGRCIPIVLNQPLSVSGVSVFELPPTNASRVYGYFSIFVEVLGDGTVTIEYLTSPTRDGNDAASGVTPDGSDYTDSWTDLCTDHGSATGFKQYVFADGEPGYTVFHALKVTESGGADPVSGLTIYWCEN